MASTPKHGGPPPPPPPPRAADQDGRASVEHQLEVLVNDIVALGSALGDGAGGGTSTTAARELADALATMRYTLDYRIANGKLTHLSGRMCTRLLYALLALADDTVRTRWSSATPAPQADEAVILIGGFAASVDEFREALRAVPLSQLRAALKLHTRFRAAATVEQREAAVALLQLLHAVYPGQPDWHDLVDDDEDAVQAYMRERVDAAAASTSVPSIAFPRMPALPPPAGTFADRDADAVLRMFETSIERGLSVAEAATRAKRYGRNVLPPPPRPSPWRMIWAQLTDFIVLVLLVGAALSAGFQEFDSAAVLLAVVVLNVTLGFSQEWRANQAIQALMTLSVPQAHVVRDGVRCELAGTDLVPGDLVELDAGDAVPADLRLVETAQLEIVESVLTGESLPSAKNPDRIVAGTRRLPLGDCRCVAFMATVVAKGHGKGVVVRTGSATEVGRVSAAIAAAQPPKTPLQRKLKRLGVWLVALSIIPCIVVAVVGIVRGVPWQEMIQVGISLAVSVIPEGLVAVVTVTMALAVRRMAQRHAIVRKLPSVETLGSVTYACADKTGTLTEGRMRATVLWMAASGQRYAITGSGLGPDDGDVVASDVVAAAPAGSDTRRYEYELAMMTMALCNNAAVVPNPLQPGSWQGIGDPTEVAMASVVGKAGMDRTWWQGDNRNRRMHVVHENAFDTARKRMSVIVRVAAAMPASDCPTPPAIASGPVMGWVLVKGAPETILHRCTERLPGGAPLDQPFAEMIQAESTAMAAKGLRVLALAVRAIATEAELGELVAAAVASPVVPLADVGDSDGHPLKPTTSVTATMTTTARGGGGGGGRPTLASSVAGGAESRLCFIGLIGLIDPPREAAREAVARCHAAGIHVVMITGDHIVTALAVAQSLGIVDPHDPTRRTAMTGSDLDALTDEALGQLSPFPCVFARVSPDNKLQIVRALQASHQIVAMTGDGVNDAAALRAADVGVAMGITGTEITKQAADIVLVDDNFATIVAAVEEGRRVYDNIQKFIVYLLSCNSAEIFVMLVAVAVGLPTPFTSIMILWVNIIADVPPSMSLGLEPPEVDVMERPPRRPQDGVLSATALALICVQGLVIAEMTLAAFATALASEGYTVEHARSLALVLMTTQQLVLVFCTRSLTSSLVHTGIVGNRWLVGAFVLSLALLCAGDYIPGVNNFLNLTPLTALDWGKTAVSAALIVAVNELLKAVLRLPWTRWWQRCRDAAAFTSRHQLRHAPLLSPSPSTTDTSISSLDSS